jgi:hypothetical protein
LSVAQSVAAILRDRVTLEVEVIDRLQLNVSGRFWTRS